MPHGFRGKQTLMRIFVGERDKCRGGPRRGKPLFQALVDYFRGHDFPGATVSRGIAGFGAHRTATALIRAWAMRGSGPIRTRRRMWRPQ